MTEKGKIEVKIIPARMALEADSDATYFEQGNGLFRSLFRYIQKNDVAMTVPVSADVDEGKMRFFVGSEDQKKSLSDSNGVKVVELPEQLVASIGYNGSYNKKNYDKHLEKLKAWLAERSADYEIVGEPIAVYLDDPFRLPAWKRAEVQIPVRRIEIDESDEE